MVAKIINGNKEKHTIRKTTVENLESCQTRPTKSHITKGVLMLGLAVGIVPQEGSTQFICHRSFTNNTCPWASIFLTKELGME